MLKRVRSARYAVAFVFFLNGFGFANWVPRLAEVKARLDMGEAAFGLALLMVALAALPAMPLAGATAGRLGSRGATVAGVILFALPLPGLALAPSPLWLGFAFLLIGLGAGWLDVAMNAQGAAVERAAGRPVMSSLHGMFSLGAMAGALSAGLAAGGGLPLFWHLAAAGVLVLSAGLLAARTMLGPEADATASGPAFVLPDRGLLGLGVIAFCVLLAEGAVADWSAIYLRESVGAPATTAAVAFAAFQGTMAAGRFAGDRITVWLGRRLIVRTGALLAAAGLGSALLLGQPLAAIAGFALLGAGLACTFPLTLSAAAERPGRPPGIAIAAICTLGYLGFLSGPPAIGLIAERAGLEVALALVVGLLLIASAMAGRLEPADRRIGSAGEADRRRGLEEPERADPEPD